MKISVLVAIFSIIYSANVFASDFCEGFKRGYITGFKQTSGTSYDPYTPYCPYQPYKGYNDPKSDYEHGYIIGYEQGLHKGRK